MALLDSHGPRTVEAAAAAMKDAFDSYAEYCANIAQEFSTRASAFDGSGPGMEKLFGEAIRLLGELETRLPETHEKVITTNARIPYSRLVDRLSDDLLRTVFKLVAAEERKMEIPRDKDAMDAIVAIPDVPQVLASVSRRWRAVVFGIPELWSHIKIDLCHSVKWIERCVALSGSCALHVEWGRSPGGSDLTREAQALFDHFPRITRVSVHEDRAIPHDFAKEIMQPVTQFGRLESLDLRGWLLQLSCSPYYQLDLSSLRFLHVGQWNRIHEWRVKNLRILRVDKMAIPGWKPLESILLSSPNLEELSLRWNDDEGDVPEGQELGDIPKLTELHSLTLEEASNPVIPPLLRALRTPNLKSLSLGSIFLEGSDLIPFVNPVLPTLEILDLQLLEWGPADLDSILDAPLPSLTTLRLRCVGDCDPEELPGEVITAFNSCPRLSHLTLTGVLFHGEHLLSVLKERDQRAELDPIGVVEVATKQIKRSSALRGELEGLGIRVGGA